jgi:tetratricopeptide (TPR) repeat protein
MSDLFVFTTLLSAVFFILGFISPKVSLFWQKNIAKKTRIQSALIYSIALVVSFIGFGISNPKPISIPVPAKIEQEEKTAQNATEVLPDNAKTTFSLFGNFISKRDSTAKYINSGNQLLASNQYANALIAFQTSNTFNENQEAYTKIAYIHAKTNQPLAVVNKFLNLARDIEKNDSLSLQIAQNYYTMGEKDNAIEEIRLLKKQGNSTAEKLWEQYNPEIKVITGYVTKCCDGTTTYSKGRGTCSSHGGVCNWNEPTYTTKRQYE